jgi:hypothetical protein
MTDASLDTMRTKVLDALTALFPERAEDASAEFETRYGVGFSLVTREPLGALPKGKLSTLGMYGGTTERAIRFPHVEITMPVVCEVHLSKEPEAPIAKTVERYLGVVEQVLRASRTLGGLVTDIEVTGDNVDIDSPHPNQADGALYFTLRYFQQMDDPKRGR